MPAGSIERPEKVEARLIYFPGLVERANRVTMRGEIIKSEPSWRYADSMINQIELERT